MFSNLSVSATESSTTYPIYDSKLPFSEYIARSTSMINERNTNNHASENCPFELYPAQPIQSGNKLKYGALLIHGLLDSPFSLRDVGLHLQSQGILCRAIVLPGHGMQPSDLLNVSYHDWIQAVRYGIETLREEVENIYLIGYSTGATLSVYHALQNPDIAGIILLSPAIKIKAPVDIVVGWHKLTKLLGQGNKEWLYKEEEIDYAKYRSITFNAINQVNLLIQSIRELRQHQLTAPIYMVVSREDETISSHQAMDFFSNLHNEESRLLLYTSIDHRYPDPRILPRLITTESIAHYSHVSIPFAPTNSHYGPNGDFCDASRDTKNIIYGAYNRIEVRFCDMLYNLGLIDNERKELTYNPDFNYMANEISQFILT